MLRTSGGHFFGSSAWDPWLIIAQIVFLQCAFYTFVVMFLVFFAFVLGGEVHLDDVLDYSRLDWSITPGWVPICSFAAASLPTAFILSYVVERVKKCLDYGVTIYFYHLLFCTIYAAFPWSVPWWVVNGCSCVVTIVLGEWLCMRRESETINLDRDRDRVTDRAASDRLRRQATLHRGGGGASSVMIDIDSASSAKAVNDSLHANERDSLLTSSSNGVVRNGTSESSLTERGNTKSPLSGALSSDTLIARSTSPRLSPLLTGLASNTVTEQRRNKLNVITV